VLSDFEVRKVTRSFFFFKENQAEFQFHSPENYGLHSLNMKTLVQDPIANVITILRGVSEMQHAGRRIDRISIYTDSARNDEFRLNRFRNDHV
jgi:hypothetical protein